MTCFRHAGEVFRPLFTLIASAVRHTGLPSGARPDGLEEFMGAFARHVPSDQQYGAGGRGRAYSGGRPLDGGSREGATRRVYYTHLTYQPNTAPTCAVPTQTLSLPCRVSSETLSTHNPRLKRGARRIGGARPGEGEDLTARPID